MKDFEIRLPKLGESIVSATVCFHIQKRKRV